ncbi:MAG: sulfite exporter TauE/SafE family protein [Bacteroidota bacterium]
MSAVGIIIVSGLSMGLLGSFHCIGMCGPLALTLPVHHLTPFKKTLAILNYNLGRAFSYALIGVFFGAIGPLFHIQQWLSIVAGSLMLLWVLSKKWHRLNIPFLKKITSIIQGQLLRRLQSGATATTFLSIGILNGFLPCGLVYMATITAAATGSTLHSALLMFAFGLGTLPIMALTMASGQYISIKWRLRFNRSIPYMMSLVALLLIIRGMNLGIPYVSPKHDAGHVSCCKH